MISFCSYINEAMVTDTQCTTPELIIFSGLLVKNKSNNVCVSSVIRVSSVTIIYTPIFMLQFGQKIYHMSLLSILFPNITFSCCFREIRCTGNTYRIQPPCDFICVYSLRSCSNDRVSIYSFILDSSKFCSSQNCFGYYDSFI